MPPPPNEPVAVDIDVKRLFLLYVAGEHDRLSELFLQVFSHFDSTTYMNLSDSNRANLLRFLEIFLTLLTQPDYLIPEKYVLPFIKLNYLVSNLVATTPFRNTDAFLDLLNYQQSNYIKILTLYSARNTMRFDRSALFETNPQVTSLWYNVFCTIYKTGLPSEEVCRHLTEHMSYHDERMILTHDHQEAYFASTYLGGDMDRAVKPFLNDVVRRSIPRRHCDNRPNPKKVAVISDLWFPSHSVYRTLSGYVRSLKGHYHLTFFHTLTDRAHLDTSIFDEVYQLPLEDNVLNVDRLVGNDFQVVYFPDIGMTLQSIMLANHRIAPIQIVGTGHPVSTWGAEIDYFFGGQLVDRPDHPEQNYSERLVLLPGLGAVHNRPLYELAGVKKSIPEVLVNCPWMGHKVNAHLLHAIRKIIDRINKPIRFRVFPAAVSKDSSYLPFSNTVREVLGQCAPVEILPACPYRQYMRLLEEGDFTLDSFHFGGSNTVGENLYIRKPTVVLEGKHWYNRIGPAMLRMIGLDELICNTEEEYVDRTLELIRNDKKREKLAARLRAADLEATVFSTKHADSFRRAIAYLIENHDRLKVEGSKAPIRIE